MVALATLGAGVLGAGASIFGANTAANAQEKAAQIASNTQLTMFNQLQQNAAPYIGAGDAANTTLESELPGLIAPINMNETALQQTPGYQFDLTQGLKATQNSAAARGLGISGAALKGAAGYATGLADNTYTTQFGIANTNRQTAYNMLSGQQSLGENAAVGVGNTGVGVGAAVGQNTIGAGNAAAGAALNSGSAIGAGANTAAQGYLLNNLLANGGAGYNNSTSNYQGLSNAQQDSLQDQGLLA
jgi:hypothetical protein